MRRTAEDIVADREEATHAQPWQARLALGFTRDGEVTRLTGRSHSGPLRVQKALYPEGGSVCHAIVVHPPGGVVGGDRLDIAVEAGPGARALLATPGAAKWYRANGRVSRQRLRMEAGAGASLEWLPQETIFFDGAQVELEQEIVLAADAVYLGCDILCFGRTASGESFAGGRVAQRISIRRDGRLIWFEQGALEAAGMRSPLVLGEHTVCATLLAAGKPLPPPAMQALREQGEALAAAGGSFGATQTRSVFVARYLGASSEAARQAMIAGWRLLRPHLLGREAVLPRIWNT